MGKFWPTTNNFSDMANDYLSFVSNIDVSNFLQEKSEAEKLCDALGINENNSINKDILKKLEQSIELQFEIIEKNPEYIKFIKNPHKQVQLRAIGQDPGCIKYIKNPDYDVCLEALDQDPDNVIVYIDIDKYPELYEKYYFMKT